MFAVFPRAMDVLCGISRSGRSEPFPGLGAVAFDQAADGGDQLVVVERLLEDRVRHDLRVVIRPGDDDPWNGAQPRVGSDVMKDVGAADARQHQVNQDHMRPKAVFEQIQRLLAMARRDDGESFLFEDGKQERHEVRVVINEQDARLTGRFAFHKDETLPRIDVVN